MRIPNTNDILRIEHAVHINDISENIKEQLKKSHFNSCVPFSFCFSWEVNSRNILPSLRNCFFLHSTHEFAQAWHDFLVLSSLTTINISRSMANQSSSLLFYFLFNFRNWKYIYIPVSSSYSTGSCKNWNMGAANNYILWQIERYTLPASRKCNQHTDRKKHRRWAGESKGE